MIYVGDGYIIGRAFLFLFLSLSLPCPLRLFLTHIFICRGGGILSRTIFWSLSIAYLIAMGAKLGKTSQQPCLPVPESDGSPLHLLQAFSLHDKNKAGQKWKKTFVFNLRLFTFDGNLRMSPDLNIWFKVFYQIKGI